MSDFLLVQVPGEGWLPFRDVFERDGKQVRDREERLAKLFLNGSRTAIDQARAIMNEGARYNIGNVERNINTPTLPLPFLTLLKGRFTFKLLKREDDDPGEVIEFKETGRPTFVTTAGNRDLPVNGRFWVDARDGTILRTELHAVDTSVEAHIIVSYELDAVTGLRVPARMEERYRRGATRTRCAASPRIRGSGASRSAPARKSPIETAFAKATARQVMIRAMRNVFFLTAIVSLFACSAVPAQQASDPAARVGNRTITTRELDDRWRADDPAAQADATQKILRRPAGGPRGHRCRDPADRSGQEERHDRCRVPSSRKWASASSR